MDMDKYVHIEDRKEKNNYDTAAYLNSLEPLVGNSKNDVISDFAYGCADTDTTKTIPATCADAEGIKLFTEKKTFLELDQKEIEPKNVNGNEKESGGLDIDLKNKRYKDNVGRVRYYDDNGQVRDEYGFLCGDHDKSGCWFGDSFHDSDVMNKNSEEYQKKQMKKVYKYAKKVQTTRDKQKKAWKELLQDICGSTSGSHFRNNSKDSTSFDLIDLPPSVLERWQKYSPPPDTLRRASHPNPEIKRIRKGGGESPTDFHEASLKTASSSDIEVSKKKKKSDEHTYSNRIDEYDHYGGFKSSDTENSQLLTSPTNSVIGNKNLETPDDNKEPHDVTKYSMNGNDSNVAENDSTSTFVIEQGRKGLNLMRRLSSGPRSQTNKKKIDSRTSDSNVIGGSSSSPTGFIYGSGNQNLYIKVFKKIKKPFEIASKRFRASFAASPVKQNRDNVESPPANAERILNTTTEKAANGNESVFFAEVEDNNNNHGQGHSRKKSRFEEFQETLTHLTLETQTFSMRNARNKAKVKRKQLTNFIRTFGIPPGSRREVWLACSGALRKSQAAALEDQYEFLLATVEEEIPEMAHIIERDLARTFPTNYHFEKEEGITAMRRVLFAYSIRNKKVGYCQSMNFLVALLLLHMEEDYAFWVLSAIVEDLVPGHYTRQMIGMHIDQRVFESLVEQRLPKLYNHLQEHQLPLASVTYQWFLCLFVNALPLETTLHVWDCFLHEGAKALFRIGLAILKMLQKDILSAHSFQDIYAVMTSCTRRKKLFRSAKLMRIAYDPLWFKGFPSSKIAALREFHYPVVQRHLGLQADWTDYESSKTEKTIVKESVQKHMKKTDHVSKLADTGTSLRDDDIVEKSSNSNKDIDTDKQEQSLQQETEIHNSITSKRSLTGTSVSEKILQSGEKEFKDLSVNRLSTSFRYGYHKHSDSEGVDLLEEMVRYAALTEAFRNTRRKSGLHNRERPRSHTVTARKLPMRNLRRRASAQSWDESVDFECEKCNTTQTSSQSERDPFTSARKNDDDVVNEGGDEFNTENTRGNHNNNIPASTLSLGKTCKREDSEEDVGNSNSNSNSATVMVIEPKSDENWCNCSIETISGESDDTDDHIGADEELINLPRSNYVPSLVYVLSAKQIQE